MNNNFKIILLGNSGVGKTSFCQRLFNQSLTVPKTTIMFDYWDTGGSERFRSLTKTFIHKSHGILIFFDLCRPQSIDYWIDQIYDHQFYRPPIIVLIGTKYDCIDTIKTSVISEITQKYPYQLFLTSSIQNFNITEASDHIMTQIINQTLKYRQTDTEYHHVYNSVKLISTKSSPTRSCCY